jgi:HD-GYP domain-containing protein (c-di-GMP phosphodiesterase class II)
MASNLPKQKKVGRIMKKRIRPKVSVLLLVLSDICEYLCQNIHQDPENVLNYALEKIVKMMGAKAGNLRLFDKSSGNLVLKASYGVSKKYRNGKPSLPVGASIAGLAYEKEKIYAVEDLRINNRYHSPEYAIKEGVSSLLSAPLTTSESKLGVCSIYFPEPRKFSQEETKFFSIFSGFLATFLTAQTLSYRLGQSYLDIAKSLIITLEEKDPYTRGHSERVKEYAVKIAEELKLSKTEIQILSDFSILHDIGKIIVDSSILNKPGKLNKEEWRIIKQHPVIGARMILPFDGLVSGIPLIKHHHERMDGKGYPDGLKGKSIPLLVQIMAVADAFDAMTSPRAYRNTLTIEDAKRQLLKNAANQFGRKVTTTMVSLIESGKITLKTPV